MSDSQPPILSAEETLCRQVELAQQQLAALQEQLTESQRLATIGTIAAGAYADLIVVDGNPLEDLGVLGGQGERIPAIMQGGRFVKNRLS